MRTKSSYLMMFFAIIIMSCDSKKSQMDNNVQSIRGIKYELVKVAKDSKHVGEAEEHIISENYQGVWYTMRISTYESAQSPLRYGISSYDEYNKRVQYLTFQAQRDFYIECDEKKIMPDVYVFENNYNVTNFESVLMSFPFDEYSEKCNECFLVFNDRVFQNGYIKFNIK